MLHGPNAVGGVVEISVGRVFDQPDPTAQAEAFTHTQKQRLLSTRLKELESEGLVSREVQPGPGVRVSYDLTAKGESLKPVMGSIKDWARRWRRS